jgi:ABC-2 type transport system ATP-binding protein
MDVSGSAAVEIGQITHRYGDHLALEEVTFNVPEGSLFGLLGPNGSGKTTLFRILTTLLTPSSGTVTIFGRNVQTHPHTVRQSISMIFQQPALDGQLTVGENLRLQGGLFGLSGGTLKSRVRTVLERFDLTHRVDDRVETLSGGLRRRTDLARGLLHQPRLLLLDEPTTGLDPRARQDLWEHLYSIQESTRTTVLMATHLMEEAERCNELAIINDGTVAVTGTPDSLRRTLGTETLWLESERPRMLVDRIEAQFGFDVRLIGRAVQIAHEDAHNILSALYEKFDDQITSATVRRPTLEDVFMSCTGRPLDSAPANDIDTLS